MALTVGQAVSLIQQGLSFRKTLAAEVLTMMDIVQYDELEKGVSLPHWLMNENAIVAGLAKNTYTGLPTNYIRHPDVGGVHSIETDGTNVYLEKIPFEDLVHEFQDPKSGGVQLGSPRFYALRSTRISVAPVPSANYTLSHDYFGHDVLPSAAGNTGTNKWLTNAPTLLVNLTGLRMAQDTYDEKAAAKFDQRYKAALVRQTTDMAAREDADKVWVLGDSDGP